MTTNLDARLAGYHSPVLSIFRIVFGLLFTMHGTQKLFDWPVPVGVPIEPGSFPMWWAGVLELVLGILITLGLFTRIAAFIASGQMAFAYFYSHWPPLKGEPASFWPIANGGEMALLYCFGFLLLATTGAGAWAVDSRRRARVAGTTAGRPLVTGTAAPRARGGLLSRFRRR